MYILGISAFYHDSAACLIKNGKIVAAAQEERFTRKKHDANFPKKAIEYCLNEAGIPSSEIDNIVFYEKPFLKFERLLETYLAFAPIGFKSFISAMPLWIKEKLFQKSIILKELTNILGKEENWAEKLLFSEHHLSHAASAFYPSPFERAAVLTLDGVGEWTTTSLAIGNGKNLKVIKEIHFPHSLGLLYSAFTYYTGFKVNSGEYKVMGLAPYGEPKYADLIKSKLIKVANDGSFSLDMSYFNFATGLTMTNKKFHNLFGGPPRKSEAELSQREMDLAASIQKVIEEIILKLGRGIAKETQEKNLCLAGGVALNCVANGVLLREKIFENIWIQPAAGDAGGALGAALAIWHIMYEKDRTKCTDRDSMKGSFLGPSFKNYEIEEALNKAGAVYYKVSQNDLIEGVASALIEGKAIGWMQGRMEFGPRALGARSIIADPRSESMQKQLNLKVKYRESFRPFAPSILGEHVSDWFDCSVESPYMLLVDKINQSQRKLVSKDDKNLFGIDKLNISRSTVPAITHVDYSARIQTVHKDTNLKYYSVINRFYELTGCPMVVNTSFNVRGEPIVCTPDDAFKCFMGTELDVLAIGDFLLFKDDQNNELKQNYMNKYELD
ncbi:carbamoyltransferase [Gammaproteobacteria bacterium]|nr:carbamoyltransferase [Gammaproteobacteria bacterium]